MDLSLDGNISMTLTQIIGLDANQNFSLVIVVHISFKTELIYYIYDNIISLTEICIMWFTNEHDNSLTEQKWIKLFFTYIIVLIYLKPVF